MPQHLPGDDKNRDDLVSLNFTVSDDGTAEELLAAALRAYLPSDPHDAPTEREALRLQAERACDQGEGEQRGEVFTVVNPYETVSVSARLDGGIQQVELAPQATRMSESELVDEILVLADLARRKGLAGQHPQSSGDDSISDVLRALNVQGGEAFHDFIAKGVALSTPEQVAAAQTALFSNRYGFHT